MDKANTYGLIVNPISGALVTGTTSTITTTVTMTPILNGKFAATLAAITNQAGPATDINTGVAFKPMIANQGCALVYCLKAGAVVVAQGPITSMLSGSFSPTPPQFPVIPDDCVPFAYQLLKCSSAAGTITPFTSNWNATGFTNAIVNVATLPDRPQTA